MRTKPGARERMLDKLHHIRKEPKLERNPSPIKLAHPTKETVVCPFDPYHIIDVNYLDRHVVNCASSSNGIKKEFDVKPLGLVPLESYANATVPIMKDWEEEEVTTYDPYINTQNRNVIRYLFLVPKSEKKRFRQSERLRIQLLESTERNGPHKEINDMVKNLGQDSLWNLLLVHMRRFDIECHDTIIENFDFDKLVISSPSTTNQERREPEERVLNIEVEKLFNNGPKSTEGRRGSISDCITSQLMSLGLNMPQD